MFPLDVKKIKTIVFLITIPVLFFGVIGITHYVAAGPTSSTYELKEYSFGSGGTEGATSTTFTLFGIAGEVESGNLSGGTYQTFPGLVFTMQANVPPAPTFTNSGSNYDRLQLTLNTGGNPTDSQFAVAISPDNFTTTYYVKSDNTIGTTLVSSDWRTYTSFGSGSGVAVTGLAGTTTYSVKVKARQGNFTESGWGPVSTAATVNPSLTFGIDANSLTFANLNSGNSYTDTAASTVLTTSTNAYNGYIVYAHETGALTASGNTIADYGSPNSAPTTWSGTGFGYTTNDNSLTGGTANRFSGSKYAGFTTSAPGDPVADHAGGVVTPISNEQFTISYRVTAAASTPAGAYTTTVVYLVVPSY